MNGESAPFVAAALTFANVHAGADADTSSAKGGDQFQRAPSRLGGSIEECEDAVAGVLGASTAVL
jgi:hypothetical protein